jgi:hypothetical protein
MKDPHSAVILEDNKQKFISTNTLYKKDGRLVEFEPELILRAIKNDSSLNELIYRADNLTYYIGHSIIGSNQLIRTSHVIPSKGFDNLNYALLGQSAGDDLRDHNSSGFFLCIGFIFAHMNMNYSLINREQIVAFYMNKSNKLDYNIAGYRYFLNKSIRPTYTYSAIKAKTDEDYDSLPINICEEKGPIKREPFIFQYGIVNVWKAGEIIYTENHGGTIMASVLGHNLNITLNEHVISEFIAKNFMFEQISTSLNRVVLSNDLLNNHDAKWVKLIPDNASIFYKDSSIVKIYFNIYASSVLIEFIGSSTNKSSTNNNFGEDFVLGDFLYKIESRVGKGEFHPQTSHRTVREPLDSYGSS